MSDNLELVHPFAPLFTADDLAQNRRGVLSLRQRRASRRLPAGCLPRLLWANAAALVLCVIFVQSGAGWGDMQVVLPVLFMLASGLFIYLMWWRAAAQAEVYSAEGRALLTLESWRGRKVHAVRLGGTAFRVPADLYSMLENGEYIILYYRKRATDNVIVSWERII